MSAAKHADLLFVKMKSESDNDLASYCEREGIKHVRFKNFSNVIPLVQQVVEGTKTVGEASSVSEV
jgi:2-hydroxy-3-keto-5-methylthiopentenyl-1-phosphate phosphatase